MNFIEELYYGNINPNEKRYDKDTHYAKTMRKFCDSENELGKMLKGKPLHLVNDLINASDEIVAITSIENFKLGFRLGVQMICDSLICDDSIANNAIWQYRDMYLRPDFYANNLEKVRVIIAPVIEDYKSGKISYAEAEFNARTKIYQSVNPSFNPDLEYMKDPMSRDIPSVDNSLFILARKLLLNA